MRIKTVVLIGLAAAMAMTMSARAQQTVAPENVTLPEMPKESTRTGKRVNRIIDMWLKNQPVYYTQISGGGSRAGKATGGDQSGLHHLRDGARSARFQGVA